MDSIGYPSPDFLIQNINDFEYIKSNFESWYNFTSQDIYTHYGIDFVLKNYDNVYFEPESIIIRNADQMYTDLSELFLFMNKLIKVSFKPKQRFVSVFVKKLYSNMVSGHATALIIDLKFKTVEIYDPHGSNSTSELLTFQESNLLEIFGAYNYFYYPQQVSCPKISMQTISKDTMGLCQTYSLYYFMQRFNNPDKLIYELHDEIYNRFTEIKPENSMKIVIDLASHVIQHIIKLLQKHNQQNLALTLINFNHNNTDKNNSLIKNLTRFSIFIHST